MASILKLWEIKADHESELPNTLKILNFFYSTDMNPQIITKNPPLVKATPVSEAERLRVIDMLRGVAL